ncbi:MAG TPA: DCC1-like thiol-disulfide oxidoreductase family protein [Burkholderiales bacterium]|nr:DCC1-like thiol-disulfide oxidoreductase family protein [Burkholderiales bacterium]
MTNQWTGGQYSIFRALLGAYLFVHFLHLVPWGREVFSDRGMLAEAATSPLWLLFPSVFHLSDAPWMVSALLIAAALAAVFFAAGKWDRAAAAFMWYVLACLFTRNPLIQNPALPYLGWMLLAHLFVPPAPYGSWAARGRADPAGGWHLPQPILVAAWVVLAVSYSYSGWTKLFSPSWVAGDTVAYVLQNPLARDHALRHIVLALPEWMLQALTWTILYVELFFAPLILSSRLRPILWGLMLWVQFGFLFLLNFADLTIPMLLYHLLTFDPAWVRGTKRATRPAAPETIHYDGSCGLCHRVVRFVLAEDRNAVFRFVPIDGDDFRVTDEAGRSLRKSDAYAHILRRLGGLWGIAGFVLTAVPRAARDRVYDAIGRNRRRFFAAPPAACPFI